MSEQSHIPVLYREVLEGLRLKADAVYVDGTLGGGSDALGILQRTAPTGVVIGIDKDEDAVERCARKLREYGDRFIPVHDDFKNIDSILDSLGIECIDGAVLDLGVSSYQFDQAQRGFSYQKDAPLDMRMDRTQNFSAFDVVNSYDQSELTRVLREYGEEKWAPRIAANIVREREKNPIRTTEELAETVKTAIPAAKRRTGGHPAKKSFQAIRIEVNGELRGLAETVERFVFRLKTGGRIAVITFHSLEDRIVKRTFRKLNDPCECPKDLPACVCGKTPEIELVNRKAITPNEAELKENRRSRSAKLRIAEKIQ